uniref:Uncharacterized protein n=1 Tax=Scophthalmus maximus TaxID=52904 RepID=A0A8D3A1Q3_SCOMX
MDLETQAQLENSTPEPQATSEANLSTPAHEPALDALMEGEQRSTLSKQDRLLIHKIRRYYEHAEDQDANFSIKRRESLSYIPAGLVRHLSRQLNSVPQEQAAPVHRKGLSRNRPTSWSVFDLPGLEKSRNTETRQKAEPQRAVEAKTGPQSVSEASTAEEEFRSSSDMLKVWQDMEMEEESQAVPQTEEEDVHDSRLEATQDTSIDTSDVKTSEQPPQILEESEICIASEGSSISSPSAISAATDGGSGQECKPSATPAPQEKNHVNQGQLPKLISFRASIDEDQILQDMGKMKNKVFQLARQYSQRIKNNRPIVWPRNRETANHQGFKNMPAVHEEKAPLRKKGKPNLRLPLTACEEMVIHEVRSPSPVQTPSSQSTVPCPQSPQSPQPETFHWPHVQELRSKYTGPCHPSNATCSCALGVLECCRSVCDSCSHMYNSSSDLHRALTDCPRTHSERCAVVEDWPQAQPRLQPLLCRWSSLDHMLGSLPLHEVQNLQDPVRTCKLPERDILPQDELDCAERTAVPSSGKMSESHLVKSLREKFQSLGTSS